MSDECFRVADIRVGGWNARARAQVQMRPLREREFVGGWAGPLHLDFPMDAAASPVGATTTAAPVTVIADLNPPSKPIPVDEKARAADDGRTRGRLGEADHSSVRSQRRAAFA